MTDINHSGYTLRSGFIEPRNRRKASAGREQAGGWEAAEPRITPTDARPPPPLLVA